MSCFRRGTAMLVVVGERRLFSTKFDIIGLLLEVLLWLG